MKQKLKRIMAVCIALLMLTTLSPAGTGIYAAETEPAIEIDDPSGSEATTEEATAAEETEVTTEEATAAEETEVTTEEVTAAEETEATTEEATETEETEAATETVAQPVSSPVFGNNGILPIDLLGGITVTKVSGHVQDFLDGDGGYFDHSHGFYKVSATDDAGVPAETICYCLQAGVSGPTNSANYSEGTGGLWGAGITDTEKGQVIAGLEAIALYGFGGSAGNKNDGGTYGTYYVNTGDGQGVAKHRGLLITGVFYELSDDEARAATQAAIHSFCADWKIAGNDPRYNVTGWKDTPGQAARALRDLAEAAAKNGINTVSGYKGYGSNTSLTIQFFDGTSFADAPADLGTIPEEKCVTYNGQKCLQFKISYSSIYTSTRVNGDGNYFNVTKPTTNTTVTYGALKAVANGGTYPTYDNRKAITFSQEATVYVPYADLKARSGQTFNLSVKTNDINLFTPLQNSNGKYSMRIYHSAGLQDMGFLSPDEHTTRTASTTFAGFGTGSVSLKKVSSNPAITNNNPCYSLAGAVYSVTDLSNGNVVGTLVTDANGNSNTLDLPYGTYRVLETKAPKGYKLDTNFKDVEINSEILKTVEFVEEPDGDPVRIELLKVDADTGEPVPAGKADLSGAQFTIEYYAGFYTKETLPTTRTVADRTWIIETKLVNGKYQCELSKDYLVNGSDSLYYDTEGNIIIPLGTIIISETKAPEGYTLDDAKFVDENGEEVKDFYLMQITEELIGNPEMKGTITIEEPSVRGDFKLRKVDENGEPMANVLFRITSDTTGESHEFLTDANGEFDSSKSDLWFGGGDKEEGTGALPYDDYTLTELECEANATRRLIDPIPVSITKDQQMVNIGDLVNDKPVIQTTAKDSETDDHISYPDQSVTIIDTVTYSGLTEGREYTLKGVLHDAATGNELYAADGALITSEVKFTPETTSGTVDVTFTFNGSNLAGKKTVVFEDLYHDNVLYATHADLTDEGQTIYFPEIGTIAKDGSDGDKILPAGSEAQLVDTMKYNNLPAGDYIVEGIVMIQDNATPLLVAGKEITATLPFTVNENGTVDVIYSFSTSGLEGKSLTVFERVYTADTHILVAAHEDITSSDQTVIVEKPPTITPPTPKTGDSFPVLPALLIFGCSGIGTGLILYRRKKSK